MILYWPKKFWAKLIKGPWQRTGPVERERNGYPGYEKLVQGEIELGCQTITASLFACYHFKIIQTRHAF